MKGVEESELRGLVAESVIKSDTLVWHEGMSDWLPFSTAPSTPTPEPIRVPVVEPAPAPFVTAMVAAEPSASAVPAVSGFASPAVQPHYCSQCGRQYPSEELARFGNATVCANCKDIYAQRIRETGHVAGQRVYGGFWIRFVAVLIDAVIMFIVSFSIGLVTGTRSMGLGRTADLASIFTRMGTSFFISTAIAIAYEATFLVNYGATPGKMAMGLKVITPDGGGISWGRAIGRYFAKFLSSITLLIGYIMAGFDSEKRALHDYVAGTRVIRVR